MPDNQKRVLVLDANQRSALAVTRSLGKVPWLEVSTADSTSKSLAGSSKYSRSYICCPAVKEAPLDFLAWLQDTIRSEAFDIVLPITDISSQLLAMNRHLLGECLIPYADYDCIMAIADKGRLLQLADQCDIPYPKSTLVEGIHDFDHAQISGFPVVIKPCLSHIWTGASWISTTVKVARNTEELDQILQSCQFLKYPFLIQEFIPGHGAGVFALFNQGQPEVFFAHNRIREKPPQGGVSVLSESAQVDQQLLLMGERLLRAANWHGVAMVEFRIGVDGTPYIMEVNTRFWGSLQLSIDSGIDFPRLLLEISNNRKTTPPTTYIEGQQLRWLLGDLDSLYLALKGNSFSAGEKAIKLLSFFTPKFSKRKHEINRISDLKPAWFELRQYFSQR